MHSGARSFFTGLVLIGTTSMAIATTHTVPDDFGTIQSALWACSAGDTVLVSPGTYFEPLEWPDTESIKMLAVADTSETFVDGLQAFRPLLFSPQAATNIDTTTQINGFTFTGGSGVENGGGLLIVGGASPLFRDCAISNNECADTGGGLRCENAAAPVFDGCDFRDNRADFGGGVGHNSSTPIFINTRFLRNEARRSGGGANNFNSSHAQYIDCLFEDNSAFTEEGATPGSGGGLRTSSGSNVLIQGCTFTGNSALFTLPDGDSGYGGAISNNTDSFVELIDCVFEDNSAGILGGGVFTFNTAMSATGCEFHNNSAGRGAGIFFNTTPACSISDCWFEGNTATFGAAIAGESDTLTMVDCTVINNTGEDWAAVDLGLEVRMEGCVIAGNTSTGNDQTLHSAVVGFYNGSMQMRNCTIANNTSVTGEDSLSSTLHFEGAEPLIASLLLENCIIYGNTADVQYDCATLTDHAISCTLIDDGSGQGWGNCLSDMAGVDGNMTGDPLFCNAANNDYHLLEGSPALAANNSCNTLIGALDAGCVGIRDAELPGDFRLLSVSPNPFNPVTQIKWQQEHAGPVTLTIYNLAGEEVRVLLNESIGSGVQHVSFNATDLASGVYVATLNSAGHLSSQKMLLLK